ncbi:MAG: type II toxin-antitoxin system VapB family antitoxin [Acidimicrobiales bacterium]
MVKRKITVTVDEEVVEQVQSLGGPASLSGIVNEALAAHVERLGRRAALGDLLAAWDSHQGAVSPEALAEAAAAFDELDGVAVGTTGSAGSLPAASP